eukprot:TRINITY_DN7289_c1_g1_i13.p1 TRINITY_DN7289_c1_g1~~TRINITY_DN7289_c1_g1_i13.p1  ORF type:complete len:332 (-),score=52.94 TRINITY_DN7289_c1_g1_i13:64-1059(-)
MWMYDPFAAHEDENGNIFARGSQDMKSVCMQYLEAVRILKSQVESGLLPPPVRTIHLSFLPDEELGGKDGACKFLDSDVWKSLNVGFVLDEGLANPTPSFTVFYGERAPWWVKIKSEGSTGHGSRFIPRTAVEKLVEVLGKVYRYRREQESLLHCEAGCKHSNAKKLGDVVTINVTAIHAGVPGPEAFDGFAINCIPSEAIMGMDIRIPPSVPLEEIHNMLSDWTQDEGLSFQFYSKIDSHNLTALDESNSWWACFQNTMKDMNCVVETEIFPAGTDSRFFRQRGFPCLGFSPISNTPILLHDHNEFLNYDVFLMGIDIYRSLINNLANLK